MLRCVQTPNQNASDGEPLLTNLTQSPGFPKGKAGLTDRVYRQIAVEIVEGRLPPGRQLLETALAKELGVSRTPVREALRLLVNEGLAMATPEGVTVTELTVKDVQDLLRTEEVLDGLACKLAAGRGTDRQMAQLEQIIVLMEEAVDQGDLLKWMEADRRLHHQIAEMADNQPLSRFSGQVNSLLVRMRHLSVRSPGRLKEANRENRRVVEAIRARDGNLAERAMHDHVRHVERVVVEILQNYVVPFKGDRF